MLRGRKKYIYLATCLLLVCSIALQVFNYATQNSQLWTPQDVGGADHVPVAPVCVVRNQSYVLNSVPILNKKESIFDVDFNIERVFSFGRVNNSIDKRTYNKSHPELIPKIIHLTWKNEIIPWEFVDNVKSFQTKNPSWDIYFWTDESSRRFIEEHYPNLLLTFDGYRHNVSKSDALRYIVMYTFGGAYFDLDTVCLKSLDIIAEIEQCIMGPEPAEHTAIAHGMTSILASSAFMCKPKHGFFKRLIHELPFTADHWDMLEAAGPKFVTRQFNLYLQDLADQTEIEYETFHVATLELFEGDSLNYKTYINTICERRHHVDTIQFKACSRLKYSKRKGTSSDAFTVHNHFNTYNNMNRMKFTTDNNIRRIIPSVKIYPDNFI